MSFLLLLPLVRADKDADKDAGNLIVQDHHRHLSTYVDGGLDQACWYNKAFVTCAVAPPNPTSPPITTTSPPNPTSLITAATPQVQGLLRGC